MSKLSHIAGQGGNISAVVLLFGIRRETRPATAGTDFVRCCWQEPELGCTETKLLFLVL